MSVLASPAPQSDDAEPVSPKPRSGEGGLPLLTRATPAGLTFALTRRGAMPAVAARGADRVPARVPGPGEQYRFHVDMKACIGCKCCVVACNEQNGNPAAINWRRVGEIEGGWFPATTRSYLSMGCNHCVDPTCLAGCPVDAYSKDPATGIVRHSADACIGCQYCTWNCSYGVPQYNADRGVVGKCDMCHGRLALGQSPACVSACPEGAIRIEIVNIAAWKAAVAGASAPAGLPVRDHSTSTTRITLPDPLPPNARPRDITHVVPAHPHWPLVVMTVLTQLSVGAFTTIWLLQLLGASTRLGIAAVTSLVLGGLALAASTLHLGRPVYAYRALRMWRRSWLSREVLLFSAFSAVAGLYAPMLWLGLPGSAAIGAITVVLGLAGVAASACIYRVPSRPAWNTRYTLLQFVLTAFVLGPLLAAAAGAGSARALAIGAAAAAGAQFVVLALRVLRCVASDRLELKGTARLLSTMFARHLVARGALLALGAIGLPLLLTGAPGPLGPSARTAADPALMLPLGWGAALALALAGEMLGRYLFFVTVVPTHMAAPYVPAAGEAA